MFSLNASFIAFLLARILIDPVIQCCIGLSTCRYPEHYFDELCKGGDEEVEIDRNDVRDVLRVVVGSGEGGSTYNCSALVEPLGFALKVMAKLLRAFEQSLLSSREHHQLFDETVIHAFSSLGTCLPLSCY